MVEQQFFLAVADKIIAQADRPTGGAYRPVETCDHSEIVALVARLSQEIGSAASVLVHVFSRFFFQRLYPGDAIMIERQDDLEDGGRVLSSTQTG